MTPPLRGDRSALDLVCAVLEEHAAHRELVYHGVAVLLNVAGADPSHVRPIADKGLGLVLAAGTRYQGDAGVVSKLNHLLAELAGDEDVRDRLVQSGGVSPLGGLPRGMGPEALGGGTPWRWIGRGRGTPPPL